MPDIAMCLNHNCFSRKSCYRYCAIPNEYRQSYMDFKPDGTGRCSDFIERKYDNRETLCLTPP